MTLDELLAKHPGPWRENYNGGQLSVFDANGIGITWDIVRHHPAHLMNRIGELQAERDSLASAHEVMRNIVESVQAELVKALQVERERDSLKAKVEELEREVTMWTNSSKHWAECHDRLLSENADIECRCTSLEQALADKVIAWTGVRKAQSDAEDMRRHLCCAEQRRFELVKLYIREGYHPDAAVQTADKVLFALSLAKPKEGTT